ncbi:MAG: phosphatidylethanolamine N-methyltransferase [Rhodobacteraceae bacterium GWE1_64_9]|nr:MAG: phosphatidylethanolamine N-methyltransferase [Rhodobacteraceae bacterium GWE1_64_9]OHC49520.1 MAG: phosphatidylethanolamine N-methyltransferase [Rhodobacteraceae bacterium GWF1_65_7]HBU14878.1 SAM-dependent methyltransferase [Gemmobacter sp.]
MELDAVAKSYARWAPVYDRTFGAITHAGRRRATGFANRVGGTVLEVGVGTGLALPFYAPHMQVTGIDFSEDMLAKAREKVAEQRLTHVRQLRQMDARDLDFADATFDTVCAMHILSVVPEPEQVMAEMARVCRPGGHVLITNHFAAEGRSAMARIERLFAPLSDLLGWHSDFARARVLGDPRLELVEEDGLPPLGMMTYLRLRRIG